MTDNQLLQVRIDSAIKEEAAAVLASMGLTDAVRLMLIRTAQDKTLTFDPLIPNETTIQAMRDSRAGPCYDG